MYGINEHGSSEDSSITSMGFTLRIKKLLYALLIIAFIVAAYMYIDWGLDDMCRNEIVEETQSPSKKFKVVIFIRDCGATTGYSTQVSILESSDQLGNHPGNAFILSDKIGNGLSFDKGGAKIKAMWSNDHSLKVYFDKRTEFTKQIEKIDDIKITYEQLVDEDSPAITM